MNIIEKTLLMAIETWELTDPEKARDAHHALVQIRRVRRIFAREDEQDTCGESLDSETSKSDVEEPNTSDDEFIDDDTPSPRGGNKRRRTIMDDSD